MVAPNPNWASPRRRDRAKASDDFYQSHAPVCTEYPVTGVGAACEVYAAGRDRIKVVVGTTDGKPLVGTFAVQVSSSLRPGQVGQTIPGDAFLWSEVGVPADYKVEGAALAAAYAETVVTGPVNRVRVDCTAFAVTSGNLAVWVL